MGKTLSLHFCCTGLGRPPSSSCTPAPQEMRNPMHASSSSNSSSSSSSYSFKKEVFKNFNSLYDPTSDSETLSTPTPPASQTLTLSSSSDEPDLTAALASRRFFLASPGRSNSIVDSTCSTAAAGIVAAVPTYTPDPYGDFKRSMEEMVAALGLDGRRGDDRVRLQELLLCYLAFNRRHAHKYIVSAFADLLRGLEGGADAAAEAGT